MFDVGVANARDLKEIHALEELCFTYDKISFNQYKTFHHHPDSVVLVVKNDNAIIASAIIVLKRKAKTLRLYSIAVHPDKRRSGVGKQLYNYIETYARDHQCEKIELEVRQDNQPALDLYLKKDFKIIGELPDYYDDGAPAFKMQKIL